MRSHTIGLIGGLGPESTIDYYRRIIELWQTRQPNTLPAIMIDSLDVYRGIALVQNDHAGLTAYLLQSVQRLAAAGCSFAAMAANTPHIVFDDVATRAPIPLLSIVDVCAQAAQARGYGRVALLGTGFTMGAAFYPRVFARHGVDIVTPGEAERAWLHEHYLGELLKGVFPAEVRSGVVELVQRLYADRGIEAVVLAGTELPLLLQADTVAGLPVLDTTELHVRRIVEMLAEPRED